MTNPHDELQQPPHGLRQLLVGVGGAVEVGRVVQEEAAVGHALVIHEQASNLFGHADQATLVVGILDVLLLVAQLELRALDGVYQDDVVYHIATVELHFLLSWVGQIHNLVQIQDSSVQGLEGPQKVELFLRSGEVQNGLGEIFPIPLFLGIHFFKSWNEKTPKNEKILSDRGTEDLYPPPHPHNFC